jgi:hypothetical protein
MPYGFRRVPQAEGCLAEIAIVSFPLHCKSFETARIAVQGYLDRERFVEIGCAKTPQLTDPITNNPTLSRKALQSLWMNLHEGGCLLAV